MFKIIKNFFDRFNKKETYGVSFDSSVKLKKLPLPVIGKESIFYKLNSDFGIFEIVKVSEKDDLVYIIEVNTDNKFTLNYKLFEYLFTNIPIPEEIKF